MGRARASRAAICAVQSIGATGRAGDSSFSQFLHPLLLGTPRLFAFFASITAVADVIAAAAPFTQPGPLAGKVFTASSTSSSAWRSSRCCPEPGATPPGPWNVPSPGGPMTTRRDASI
jgi:hypothetical protein